MEIEGYKSKSLYRNRTVGGGIKVFHLESISVRVLENFTMCTDVNECLLLGASVPGVGEITICSFYRIPNKPFPCFFDALNSLLQFCENRRSIFCGDFNLDVSGQLYSRPVQEYFDLMISYGFLPKINLPTCMSPSDFSLKTCLDHFWHNLSISSQS